jgi:hypothetical protein
MDKQIFFGAYTQAELDDMGIDNVYEHNGSFYEYRLDVHLEDGFCRLTDSIGRMVPIDHVHYREFVKAIEIINALQNLQYHKQSIDSILYDGKSAVGLHYDDELDTIIAE